MKRKLGIIAEAIKNEDSLETLDRIANAGFESTFTGRYDLPSVEKLVEKCEKLGLDMEFIHAPFNDINAMWLPGDKYKTIYGGMIQSIDSAAATGNVTTTSLNTPQRKRSSWRLKISEKWATSLTSSTDTKKSKT